VIVVPQFWQAGIALVEVEQFEGPGNELLPPATSVEAEFEAA
jgi:hypothetical protein